MGNEPKAGNDPAGNTDEPAANVHSAAGTPHVAPPTDPQTAEEHHRAAERRYWRRQVRVGKWLNAITAIAALAGIIGLVFVYRGLIATRKAADAATRQAEISEDTAKRQIRGYLGITEMRFDCKDCVLDETNNIEVKSENYGATPLIVMTGVLWMTQFGINESFPIQEWSSQDYIRIAEEMPHYPRTPMAIGFRITSQFKEMIDKARQGEAWLAIRGLVSYRDVFNDLWGNRFCFIYNPKINLRTMGFTVCQKYNGEKKLEPQQSLPPFVAPLK